LARLTRFGSQTRPVRFDCRPARLVYVVRHAWSIWIVRPARPVWVVGADSTRLGHLSQIDTSNLEK